MIDPKYGGRIRAAHSAIVGARVSKNSKMTSVHMPSHWVGIGRHIRAAAITPPSPHSVTIVAATSMWRRVSTAIPQVSTPTPRAVMNTCADPRSPGAPAPRLTASSGTASHANPSNRSLRCGHHRATAPAPPMASRPAAPVTMLGTSESPAERLRRASPSTTAEIIARMASAVCVAVTAVTGWNSFLPIRASPVDKRLVLRLERVAVDYRSQHQRGAVFDAEFVEGLGDVQPHTVGFVQFVADSGFQPGHASALEFVIEHLDDVVDEHLHRHRCRIHLRDKVFATYHRNCAARRKCDLRHYRGLSASGTYLSANAAVISNSRSRVFFCNSCCVSMIPPLAKCGS